MNELLKSQIRKIADLDITVQIGILMAEINYIRANGDYDLFYKHAHSCFEIHYILFGEEIVLVDDQAHHLKAGDVYFIGRNTEHCVLNNPQNCKLLINFDLRTAKTQSISHIRFSKEETTQLIHTLYKSKYWIGRRQLLFTQLIEQIANELLHKKLGYFTIIQNLLANLIVYTIQSMEGDHPCHYSIPEKAQENLFIQIIHYVFDRYQQDIAAEEVAAHFSISTRHLNRILKEHTGLTLQQLLLNIRMERAKRFIRNSTLSVEQVSENVGFSSQHYLSKLFKKMEGQTISEFRNCKV